MIHKKTVRTRQHEEMIEITGEIEEIVRQEQVEEGLVVVYCPHTTAGIAINENADPDVKRDLLMGLGEVYPWEHPDYRHGEGNSAAHLKAVAVGTSQTVLVENGRLLLGRWQGIYFCEFDGPRVRNFYVKVIR